MAWLFLFPFCCLTETECVWERVVNVTDVFYDSHFHMPTINLTIFLPSIPLRRSAQTQDDHPAHRWANGPSFDTMVKETAHDEWCCSHRVMLPAGYLEQISAWNNSIFATLSLPLLFLRRGAKINRPCRLQGPLSVHLPLTPIVPVLSEYLPAWYASYASNSLFSTTNTDTKAAFTLLA